MTNGFTTKLRDGGNVTIITIPSKIMEYLNLKLGDVVCVDLKKIIDTKEISQNSLDALDDFEKEDDMNAIPSETPRQ